MGNEKSEGIQKLRARSIKVAMKAGYSVEIAEDFGSFAVLKVFEEHSILSLSLLLIDFLRMTFGYHRHESGYEKSQSLLFYEPLLESMISVLPDSKRNWAELIEKANMKLPLRAVFLLHYHWGFSYVEIAAILGRTPARVTQIMAEVYVILQERMSIGELRDFLS